MDFSDTIGISASGMRVQSARLRIAAENLANEETTGSTPGADPYRRKTITFKDEVDAATGVSTVKVKEIGRDPSDFQLKYDPSHPAADEKGYVKMPNVNSMVEIMDTHDAQHSYEANLNTMQITRSMLTRSINLMKN
ncbi:flagellar basal-body rod protein FlgC [Acetobacter pasteurianus]|uniref:Flagellar basal-body rod protein FlgC n=2 Tax=Acetobacter TaxID=434 RepID=A0A401X8G4_ACEPA|nr:MULTISPECIES: flagellar basal body rod protein FlgC [Acetobacter]PHY92877.1 flagellar basal body rod protein FlgC [Acetobacter pomorum]QHM90196.1 flagellar basal body rod protein FlgC [Acetobacter pasteurianus]GBR46037.1 flagellar basal body rod protein FlgC [Acetobacter pomorum DSM 11825]GCD60444.1 flagellar basal body rod protein FlgC [Acetobacter pasteurianus NBRC 3277]GCD64017.1 flagellar basal body rod protein FlgC [Acetobacter pasteurianus NBRC 3278]